VPQFSQSLPDSIDVSNVDDLWVNAPFALGVITLPDGVVVRCNRRYRQIYALETEKDSQFDSLSLMDENSKTEARVQYRKLSTEPNQLVEFWRTYVDRSGRVFRGFVRAHTFDDSQTGKKVMLGAVLDVDRSAEIAEDLILQRVEDARTGIAKVVANELNNALATLLSSLEIEYGDSVRIPDGVRSALNSTMQISRKLLILGWSGERPGDSSVIQEMVDKFAGFRSSLGPDDTQEHAVPSVRKDQIHVLIVDDDVNLASTLSEGLIYVGIKAQAAHDGPTALEYAERTSFTHALIDLRIGEESGFVVATSLKAQLPDLQVIFMTGYTTLNNVESKVRTEPMLMKPFRLADFMSLINEGSTAQ
jgi:CheY-like chemotaxis protein